MTFVRVAGAATALVLITLSFQCAGMALLIRWGRDHLVKCLQRPGPRRFAVLLVRFMSQIICMHMLEILLWAWFYRLVCLPSWESSFYFSTTSYSSVGYGDVVLPGTWRALGPIESVTGVLMCGLSVSLMFAIVTRLVGAQTRISSEPLEKLE